MTKKPVMLLILDGWGYRKETTADNAIQVGNTPNWDNLLKQYPNSLIQTSGLAVGLPDGQMGNSEVGHTNLGAGRVVMQDLPKIDEATKDGSLEQNKVLQNLIKNLKASNKACHLMGLMSFGGVHSSQAHITSIAKILDKNGIKTWVHGFLDGRDTPPSSAIDFLQEFEESIADLANVKIATISGRFYAMDRDNRWDRVEKAHNAIALGQGDKFATSIDAIKQSYEAGTTDEFVVPCIIGNYEGFADDDAILMANFRADRAREILYALADKEFAGFERQKTFNLSASVGLTEYSSDHARFMQTMYPPEALTKIFGEIVSQNGLTQLRIAETEKYAHVTFFFNGGEEKKYAGESRILIPSPKVATYDLKPEMSVFEVTQELEKAINNQEFDVIICNFANGDMVGHTGIIPAAIKAVEAVDKCVGKVVEAIKNVDGVLLVTADHGNAERMIDEETGEPYTAHTTGDVQAILINGNSNIKDMQNGKLADIAPTLLDLLDIEKPQEMTGKSLLIKD